MVELATPTRSSHELLQDYFQYIYKGINLNTRSMQALDDQMYGEIYFYALRKLLAALELTSEDVVLDLGSGLGQAAMQIYFTSPVKSVYGVEIHKQRCRMAQKCLTKIQQQLPALFDSKREIKLLEKDFLKAPLEDVTVIYTCSTAFSSELLQQIGSKINQMPKIHTVASFRKIPGLARLKLQQTLHVECSWDTVLCYLYKDPQQC